MRLFTGISIPADIVEALERAVRQLRPAARLHWSPLENLHITTKFIGLWAPERLAELQSALAGVKGKPFDVAVSRFGFFPTPHHPHTFFAGVRAEAGLTELAAALDSTLASLGSEPEKRPFLPHLTLARIKDQSILELREKIAALGPVEFGTFRAEKYHLYLSEAAQGGSVYTILETYPLSTLGQTE